MRHEILRTTLALTAALILTSCTGTAPATDQNAQDKASVSQVDSIELNSSGNGEFYGGKPQPGVYQRKVPATNCATSPQILGEVLVTETGVVEKIMDPKTCTTQTQSLSFNDLTYANYFTGRVGHSEGLYTKTDDTGSGAGTIEEAWCRGISSTTETGFDVVIRADYKNKIFQAHVVSAKKGRDGKVVRKEHPPLTVSRRVDQGERVRYRVEEQFEIDIETSAVNPWGGTMRGEFKYEINGFDSEQWLDCRLGGALDQAIR